MTKLLIGKLIFCAFHASMKLTVMFLWDAAVFPLDLSRPPPGFFVMTAATSIAVASFGMLPAGLSRTRAQLAAISTLLILTMSAMGDSMFPRFLMPALMQKLGPLTFNAWTIDGYTKVFGATKRRLISSRGWRRWSAAASLCFCWRGISQNVGSILSFAAIPRSQLRINYWARLGKLDCLIAHSLRGTLLEN
jgi:hypothetical protein